MEDNLKQQMLDMLLGSLTDEAKKFAQEEIEKIKDGINKDLEGVRKDASKLKTELNTMFEGLPTVINVGSIEAPKREMVHKCFYTISKILSSAKRKEKNIMLVGGAGGGKTHVARQIANALGLPFYPMSVGLQTTKSDLLGFINAVGGYVPSCIRKAYENGGVLLLDEFDSAHAGVVTILNSLLANGHCSFPDKVIDKHKDFICIVACNTYGNGANLEYIGRNRLDGATLDRFIIVDVDYDEKLEKKLTDNNKWYSIVNKIRDNAEKNGIKIIISPRACMDGADLLDAGFSYEEVIDMTIIKGNSQDIKKKLLNGVKIPAIETKVEEPFEEEKKEEKEPEVIPANEYFDMDFVLDEKENKCYCKRCVESDMLLRAYPTDNKIEFHPYYTKSGAQNGEKIWLQFKTNTSESDIGIADSTYGDMIKMFEQSRGFMFEGGSGKTVRFICKRKSGEEVIYTIDADGHFTRREELPF